jgi:Flp pilus assembly protein TadD
MAVHQLLQPLGPPMADIRTPLIGAPQRDLLCALAYVYLACGQARRALALLNLIESDGNADVGVLRVLAYAFVAAGEGEEALGVIERVDLLDRTPEAVRPMLLLRAHALRLAGRMDEARACFRVFAAQNEQQEPS